MYLSGSKWSMRKKKRPPASPWRILALLALIAVAVYLERVIVPTVPPLFVPTPTPTRSPASVLLEAESLFQAGKLNQAAVTYQEAITVDPGKATYYVDLARVQALNGELDAAEESARNALLIDGSSAEAFATLAWVLDLKAVSGTVDQLTRLELLNEARANIDRALQLSTGSARVHAYHAEILIDEYIYLNEDTYQQALSEAQTAVQTDPQLLDAHRALAVVWEATGNYEQAMESYQAALRLNNNLSLLHLKVGDMYMAPEVPSIDQAVDAYLRASTLDPTNTLPLRRIVRAYARSGQYARASQYAADAVRLEPSDPYLHGLLGQMYRRNNQVERAVEELALAIHGGNLPGTWTISGREVIISQSTEIAEGLEVGSQVQAQLRADSQGSSVAVRIDPLPESPPATADPLIVSGAVEAIRPAVRIDGIPLDPADDAAVELYYTYVLALSESNRCDLAVQIGQTLLLGIPDNEIARFNAEEALRACGSLEVTPTPDVTATPGG